MRIWEHGDDIKSTTVEYGMFMEIRVGFFLAQILAAMWPRFLRPRLVKWSMWVGKSFVNEWGKMTTMFA